MRESNTVTRCLLSEILAYLRAAAHLS